MTEVATGGSNLSGGQRLRIGVARAVYAFSCDLLLLDDPYAALDATTAQQLSEYLTAVVVGQQRRTVIVATHSVTLLHQAELILVLDRGQEVARGKYHELQRSNVLFQQLVGEQLSAAVASADLEKEGDSSVATEAAPAGQIPSSVPPGASADQEPANGENLEFSASGYLERRVYWAYLTSVGACLSLVIVVTTIVMQAVSIGLSLPVSQHLFAPCGRPRYTCSLSEISC
jgi:ABC-type proline/glycine betaine transport system ATPase subunit